MHSLTIAQTIEWQLMMYRYRFEQIKYTALCAKYQISKIICELERLDTEILHSLIWKE